MVKTPRFYCREKVRSLVGELRSHMLHSKANKQTNMQEMLSDSHGTQKSVSVLITVCSMKQCVESFTGADVFHASCQVLDLLELSGNSC